MADALCGPSNALQNFQKHTSVDRTLQQDRLTNRQPPSQGFRSASGANVGALDSEFEAFQAGHASPPQHDFHHPPQFAHRPPPPQFSQPSQAPGWATDFQRLNISSPPPYVQQSLSPQAATAASWHQDFLQQQSPIRQTQPYQQNSFVRTSTFGMGTYGNTAFQQSHFGPTYANQRSSVAQGKQPAQETIPAFDEAAFERAFQQAHEDALQEELQTQKQPPEVSRSMDVIPDEPDPIMKQLKEKRLPVYLAIRLRSSVDLSQTENAQIFISALESLEETGRLTEDISEAKWIIDTLQKISHGQASSDVVSRAEALITATNERLMSSYPLLQSHVPILQDDLLADLEAAGYTTFTPQPESIETQPEEQKKEEPSKHDDDEMAETAGRLLEKVADNTSEKFQNSQFLELMRRLRDREVRVEGDKVVETNSTTTTSIQNSTNEMIPPNEQDLDFGR